MTAAILDGRELGRIIEKDLVSRIKSLKGRDIHPHLAVVIVGDDPASHIYVRNKEMACERCGIKSTRIDLDSSATEVEILQVVEMLNLDDSIHGILVQSPLPKDIDESLIIDAINPKKDVDGFHNMNLGRLVQGNTSGLLPCTPAGLSLIHI